MIFLKILLTLVLIAAVGALCIFQLRKVQEVAIQPGGMTFFSSKVKMYVSGILAALAFISSIVSVWLWVGYLIFISIGLTLVLMELAISCYCALSDKTLFVMQTMPLKEIRSIHPKEKGKGYQVEFDFNGVCFKHNFNVEGYEYIKQARRNRKALTEGK